LYLSPDQSQVRLAYFIGDTIRYLTDTVVLQPEILTSLSATGNLKPVQVNAAPLNNGVLAYSDRGHVWAEVPSILQGAQFVKLGQDDKASPTFGVSFDAAIDGTFFLLLDNRIGPDLGTTNGGAPPNLGGGVMDWVLTSGFVDSGVDISLDENPVAGTTTVDQTYSVYFRQVTQGETFTFREQNNGNFRNMYGIAAVSPQVTPVVIAATPDAILRGGNSTLQWTVPLGFTSVTINPGAVDVTAVTDTGTGVGSLVVSPTVDTIYTLTYSVGTGPVSIPPVTVNVNTFTATPGTIFTGQSSTLAWDIPAGATAVTISSGVGDVTSLTDGNGVGSVVVNPAATTLYALSYLAPGDTLPTNTGSLTVTVATGGSAFDTWMSTNYPGITAPNNTPEANPDGDNLSNFGEFAFAGDPGSGSNNGLLRSGLESVGISNHMTLTFACRAGAAFTGSGPATATVDGVTYAIRASTDLASFTVPVDEVSPAITTGLPAVPTGYEYRTFRITGPQSANPKAFLQALASP
jgi:hypothetical protein